MEASKIYLVISIVVLPILVILLFVNRKNKSEKLSPLAGIAFGFIIAGIIFSENRLIGYGLMGIGLILSIIDIIVKYKSYKRS